MSPKHIVFAGAPEANSLDWNEEGLLNGFIEPIARFAGADVQPDDVIPGAPAGAHPRWRSLPLERQHLNTGLTQSFDHYLVYTGAPNGGAAFFTASQADSFSEEFTQSQQGSQISRESVEQVLSKFYEESHAKHEDTVSSQIAPASDASISFASNETSLSASSFPSNLQSKDVPIVGHLSNLDTLPIAGYLDSIQPQTMTVNLIVGIISVPSPKTIKTRRGATVELMEILVGDETRSGFGVNFWLSTSQKNETRAALQGLRSQDIVLMRNVALSSFRGKVYGQSLRKEMTKIYLLYRNRVGKDDIGGCYSTNDLKGGDENRDSSPQVDKTRNVREWVMRFVGVGAGVGTGTRGGTKNGRVGDIKEVLPPDTQ